MELSLELKTELFMAIEDYEAKGTKKRDSCLDITALDNESNDKVLLRLITEPESKSGYVGANAVDRMVVVIKNEDYDKGVLISKRFTKTAKRKLVEEGIQRISDNFMVHFEPARIYSVVRDLVDSLCKAKCGKIPQKESDCKGHINGSYLCRVRFISDSASFHFERGWTRLLKKDAMQLLHAHKMAKSKIGELNRM